MTSRLLLVLLLLPMQSCVTTIPGPQVRQRVPEEIGSVYLESGRAYVEEAHSRLTEARSAAGLVNANRHLAQAWEAMGQAWDRYALAGEPGISGLCTVLISTIEADCGDIPDGIVDGLDLFADMMRRIHQGGQSLRENPAVLDLLDLLHRKAQEPSTSFDQLRRQWAGELAIWRLEGARSGSPHQDHMEDLLRRAELSRELRGLVPYKWSRAAWDSLLRPEGG